MYTHACTHKHTQYIKPKPPDCSLKRQFADYQYLLPSHTQNWFLFSENPE